MKKFNIQIRRNSAERNRTIQVNDERHDFVTPTFLQQFVAERLADLKKALMGTGGRRTTLAGAYPFLKNIAAQNDLAIGSAIRLAGHRARQCLVANLLTLEDYHGSNQDFGVSKSQRARLVCQD
jgi:hypothetical protein